MAKVFHAILMTQKRLDIIYGDVYLDARIHCSVRIKD
jgi:hypothetical protein